MNKHFTLFVLLLITIKASSAEKALLNIAYEDADNTPYSYIVDNKPAGFHIDLVEQANKEKVNWLALPWLRIINTTKNDQNFSAEFDAVIYMSKSTEREKYFYFHPDNILHEEKLCYLVRKSSLKKVKYDGTIKSLKSLYFTFPKDYLLSDMIENAKKSFLTYTEYTGTLLDALRMFENKRIDVTVVPEAFFESNLTTPSYSYLDKKDVQMLHPCFAGSPRFIVFNKKNPNYKELAEDFAKKLRAFKKTKDYKKLLDKYRLKNQKPEHLTRVFVNSKFSI